jgi:hypothetical protein
MAQKILGVDEKVYEEIKSLENFWKRYNKVLLDVIAIRKQKAEIERQNEALKSMLQTYYEGFTINNVIMTNENPLLIIDSREDIKDEKIGNTLQEAGFIVCDVNKQFHFNLIK